MIGDIQYQMEVWDLDDLIIGYEGKVTRFGYLPYEKRVRKDLADYHRLMQNIAVYGIKKPLITFTNHVLVGQRRAEIGKRLGIPTVTVWRLTEDIDRWMPKDMHRIDILKLEIGEEGY